MKDRHRIPQRTQRGVAFVRRTDNYLQLVVVPMHGTRLGLTSQNMLDWYGLREEIDACFLIWSDASKKTKPGNAEMAALLKKFRKFAQPLMDLIAASPNLTTSDEAVFNLVGDKNRKKASHRESAITEKCFSRMHGIGGGEMRNKVRTNGNSKRDHIFEEATGFESAYTITSEPVMLTDPENAKSKTFTRASVVQELGVINKGKYINHRERWVFASNTKFNGPWSSSQSDLID